MKDNKLRSEYKEPAISEEDAIAIAAKHLSQSELEIGIVDHTSAESLTVQTGRHFSDGYYFVRFVASRDLSASRSFARAIVVNDQTGEAEDFLPM